MHIGSIGAILGPVCFLACQRRLLLHKKSTIDVLVVSMSSIIIYAHYIFSLYAFLSAHSKDDDEFDGYPTTNG